MTINDDAMDQFLRRCEPELSSPAERHRRLRAKLIKFFQWKRCEDPEGLADETIGRIVTKVSHGEQIDNPTSYARGVAMNVYREYVREAMKRAPILVDLEDALEVAESTGDPHQECFQDCLRTLSDDKRQVLVRYYSDEGSREELAAAIGVTLAGLRTKVHRIKVELKECYQKCIKGSPQDS